MRTFGWTDFRVEEINEDSLGILVTKIGSGKIDCAEHVVGSDSEASIWISKFGRENR